MSPLFPPSLSRHQAVFHLSLLAMAVLGVYCADYEAHDMNVLLVGNSYTHYGGGVDPKLNDLLREALSSPDTRSHVDRYSRGGSSLEGHVQDAALNGYLDPASADFEPWDFVVLQDQSQVPAFHMTWDFFERRIQPVIELDDKIAAIGATTVLFQTWGRRDGDRGNPWLSDFPTMQREINTGYFEYRDAINTAERPVLIAPVGLAFEAVYNSIVRSGGDPLAGGSEFRQLYHRDGSHPSEAGSYLAACVIYATITGLDPRGLTAKPVEMADMDRDLLQEYAWIAVSTFQQSGWSPAVPDGTMNIAPNDLPSFIIRVEHDDYPEETSWRLYNLSENREEYRQEEGEMTEDEVNVSIGFSSLPVNTNYQFSIRDEYGDGICCGYGRGFISIVDDRTNEVIFSHEGDFVYSISVMILGDSSGGLSLGEVIIN